MHFKSAVRKLLGDISYFFQAVQASILKRIQLCLSCGETTELIFRKKYCGLQWTISVSVQIGLPTGFLRVAKIDPYET